MKTCPDCAESVQDAARKCRYCGYRFEGAPGAPQVPPTTSDADPPFDRQTESEATDAPAPAPKQRLTASPQAAELLLALGAAVFGVATAIGIVGHFTGVSTMNLVGAWGIQGGATLLAIAWFALATRGRGSVLLGGAMLLVPLSAVVSRLWIEDLSAYEQGARVLALLSTGAVFFAMLAHATKLADEVDFALARAGAVIAAVGVGLQVLLLRDEAAAAPWLMVTLLLVYGVGAVLFAIGLVAGAFAGRA